MPTLRETILTRSVLIAYIVISVLVILIPGYAISQNVLFEADFENSTGDNNWTLLGGATDGNWLLGQPSPYTTSGFLMETTAFEGTRDLLTGQNFSQDVDGGPTRARSAVITLPPGSVIIDFEYYFAYNTSASSSDYFSFNLRRASDDGLLLELIREEGSAAGKPAAWSHINRDLSVYAGQDVYLEVESQDGAGGSKIEAAVDLVRLTTSSTTSVQGVVYEDLDVDGALSADEGGLAGITVTLYQGGVQTHQTTTDVQGFYEFPNLITGDPYQLVFSGWAGDVSESVIGPDNEGAVQNVLVGEGFNHLGLYTTSLQCSDNPFLLLPCYVEGVYNTSISAEPSIVKVRASADGHDFIGTNYTSDYEASAIADYGAVGTVYGMAWQSNHKVAYAGAFHKRYTSFGPQGADAIYQTDLNGNVLGHISLDNLLGGSNTTGGDVHDLTPGVGGEVYDLGVNNSSFDAVGKRGFGDIELSADYTTLYVVNLFDRKIYAINVSNGQTSSAAITNSWNAPDQSGAGRHRPFALAWDNGQLWVGSVDENGQNGWVHSLDVQTGQFTLELTIPIQFDRQAFYGNADNTTNAPARWNAWQSSPNFTFFSVNNEIAFPQPMITDIEFATNGDMIIGFRDRFGDQSGAGKFFEIGDNTRTWGVAQGDILKACAGATFTLETGTSGACPVGGGGLGNSGPNGQEFYYWDIYELEQNTWDPASNTGAFHWETTQGGLAQIDSFDYVITTAIDPIDDFSGGIIKLNNLTGAREGVVAPTTTDNVRGGYTIFEGGDYQGGLPPNNGYAAKANGLGDIEIACLLPLTIGNLVWHDIDKDGLLDETESGLGNVTVEIYRGGNKLGETVTDANGHYYFGSFDNNGLTSGNFLEANTTYELRVSLASVQANDGSVPFIQEITLQDANGNSEDLIDSDASTTALYASVLITTGLEGSTDYSIDFGYTSCPPVMRDSTYAACAGDGFSITVGASIYDESNLSGVDTLMSVLGCDSIVTTLLVFHPVTVDSIAYQGCAGDGYFVVVDGTTYDESNPNGTVVLTSGHGCDSTIVIDLMYDIPVVVDAGMPGDSICPDQSVDLLVLGASINGGVSTGTWSSIGGGTFDNGGVFGGVNAATTYQPSATEISLGMITLTLTSDDPPGACPSTSDDVDIVISGSGCSSFDTSPSIICDTLIYDDFEGGLGNWDDPGSDCALINNATWASNGTGSVRLRDNSNTSMTTSTLLDLSSADTVVVDFSYIARSMENGEDFWLQLSTDGGATFTTIEDWIRNVDFDNNIRYFEEVKIPGPLTSNSRFRFVCDASNNNDRIYLDQILITGCMIPAVECPTINLVDTTICRPDLVLINGEPQGNTAAITSHLWTDLGTGTAAGYTLSNVNTQTLSLDADGADPGTVFLSYTVTAPGCSSADTMVVLILSDPICDILSDTDTLCIGTSLMMSAFNNYLVTPDSGFVAASSTGSREIHDIIGVQDPASVKVIITLPTWDDHFDTVALNGQMILPEVFEPASYDAGGMNCLTPWVANVNGLPRSIIEITSDSVKYFSSLTPTSTVMTQVFPTNWSTTPQPFVEGANTLQFGIQNTAGPVGGSWYVEAIGTVGYTYLWSTGETTESITVSPSVTTTYQLTVTSPAGCTSSCDKTIYVNSEDLTQTIAYEGCTGDGYSVEVNNTIYDESNPVDTIVLTSQGGCDSTIIVDLFFHPEVVVEGGMLPGPLCSNSIVALADLGASITGGTTTGSWTSMGGGTFDNAGRYGGANPAVYYTPSQVEIDQGIVILTLTSHDPPGPCEPEADAVMILINDVRCAQFPWAGGQ